MTAMTSGMYCARASQLKRNLMEVLNKFVSIYYKFQFENHIIFLLFILILKKFIDWSKRVWLVNHSKCLNGQ